MGRIEMRKVPKVLIVLSLLLFASCAKQMTIVNDVPEREANEIVVFLASKGIRAEKLKSPSATGAAAAGAGEMVLWSIAVDEKNELDAMAILNRNGLPRKKTTKLLDLFAKSGLISSEREENIRYQAGLAAQIAGTIRKIDGVIDADVELSIPQEEGVGLGTEQTQKKRITAAVYVKHQGILDDPNSHLITKIKRLVSGSIAGLDLNDVTVISDRSRFTDISLKEVQSEITPKAKEYVSIWSIVMNKSSAARFRFLFFLLIFGLIVLAAGVGWMLWKFYPILRKKGLKNMFSPIPFRDEGGGREEPPEAGS